MGVVRLWREEKVQAEGHARNRTKFLLCGFIVQGRQDLNLQPRVLETRALPS